MFYEIPDGVEVPEHAHGAQWGVVLEGTMEFTIGGETRTYGPGETYYVPDVGRPQRASSHPGYVGIDVFADADRYQAARRVLSTQLARVDEQRAARHQEREVARAEEDDARDVVGHRDAAERQLRAELVEGEPGRLERRRARPRGPASASRSERPRAPGCRAGRARPRVPA